MQVKYIMIHSLAVLEPTFIYIRQDIPVKAYAIGEQLRTSLNWRAATNQSEHWVLLDEDNGSNNPRRFCSITSTTVKVNLFDIFFQEKFRLQHKYAT